MTIEFVNIVVIIQTSTLQKTFLVKDIVAYVEIIITSILSLKLLTLPYVSNSLYTFIYSASKVTTTSRSFRKKQSKTSIRSYQIVDVQRNNTQSQIVKVKAIFDIIFCQREQSPFILWHKRLSTFNPNYLSFGPFIKKKVIARIFKLAIIYLFNSWANFAIGPG